MCLLETKVQDQGFSVEAIRKAGYHVTDRGMKAYNGVATLAHTEPVGCHRAHNENLNCCRKLSSLQDEILIVLRSDQ